MQGIGTLITIIDLKLPTHFHNPGTLCRDKLCALPQKTGKNKNYVPLCVPRAGGEFVGMFRTFIWMGWAWQPWAAYSICSRSASRPTLPRL